MFRRFDIDRLRTSGERGNTLNFLPQDVQIVAVGDRNRNSTFLTNACHVRGHYTQHRRQPGHGGPAAEGGIAILGTMRELATGAMKFLRA